jgi:16S rRNA (cytosine967-C5)-methyltransferase
MNRLGLLDRVTVVAASVEDWQPGRLYDGVLLDAPCTATGTIRRHPDLVHLKRPGDVERLADLQRRLIRKAADLVAPGGTLVYATCSLEPEEGPRVVADFLQDRPEFSRAGISVAELGGSPDWITADGDLRTLPYHGFGEGGDGTTGLDGFFAARLVTS